MPDGGKLTITVSRTTLAPEDEAVLLGPGEYAVLEVVDTGSGMDEETVSRIFEPFFTTKPEGTGTGLGLATVYGIVKQSKGDIQVDSRPGVGTTFRVLFPLTPEPQETQPDAEQGAGDDVSHAARGSETIMLVDDETAILSMTRAILQSSGYTVHAALDVNEVLELWNRHKDEIDLLLTDVVMPGMSGIELGSRFTEERPELRVLCMSAYTDSAVVNSAASASRAHFLAKPFTPAVLLDAVRETLTQ